MLIALYRPWLIASLLLCFSVAQAFAKPVGVGVAEAGAMIDPIVQSYRLANGDRVSVQVYREAELSKEYVIAANGRIAFPLLGEMKVAGLTAPDVGVLLTKELRGKFLIDPQVTVTVVRYRPVYINGEVKSPGAQDYEPGLTVRQAISLAGGLTDRASPRKIFRVGSERIASDKLQKVGLDQELRPGDTITIEESFF